MNILINGVFDVLTPGHINLLLYARQLAEYDHVIVALDDDVKVMTDKGLQRPIFTIHERAKALMDLKIGGQQLVNRLEFFETNRVLENIIRRIKPDVLLKGSDWKGRKIIGEEYAGKVVFFERMDYSSTEVIRRVLEKHTVLK